ncbi:palmitoyl-acyl carrier protein thioesterase, chloroplastic-like [Vicia villosa]|uniref:palmitoyl-acyl carrier protein thioesterase, chloroplastic-like n=1 Tax=Vicia villosa TaxID=3911 RepID=UPI00273B23AF|nr:palmitoyl-acyl carrier protein thioesterase, chloroplastic-like [Vicia villosa]
MVVTAATASFFPVTSSSDISRKPSKHGATSVNFGGFKSKQSSNGINLKANASSSKTVFTATPVKVENDSSSQQYHQRTFINQLPDWSVLLAAVTTIFLAAEKQWTTLDWKPRRPDMLADPFGIGKIVNDGFVFRQSFPIRSYEIGADKTASIETLMNHLQETALNHVKTIGLLGDGFGSTPEMCKKNLIWVVTRMQIVVDRYPVWGDVVQVDTWVSASGKNGMRRDWLVRDTKTGEVMTRASSVWVMMNKLTRKLSKIPEEAKEEIEPYFVNSNSVLNEDNKKLTKLDDTAEYIRTGLSPRWNDLDVNQHVNNVKYIGWILESAPQQILESHELHSVSLEYRKECGRNSVLESLTDVTDADIGFVECKHLLRLEDGAEIVRGRTEWRPKAVNNFDVLNQVPSQSI